MAATAQESKLREMLRPDDVCAYESMRAAELRLRNLGLRMESAKVRSRRGPRVGAGVWGVWAVDCFEAAVLNRDRVSWPYGWPGPWSGCCPAQARHPRGRGFSTAGVSTARRA